MPSSSDSTPKRESFAALALFEREEAGATRYLTQWNLNWRALNLVGGHKRADESFRDCLIRELEEELGFTLGADYLFREIQPTRLTFDAYSDNAWTMTSYVIEVFPVALTGEAALAKVAVNPDNHWVSAEEIHGGRSMEGLRISAMTARVVTVVCGTQGLTRQDPGPRPE